MLADFRPGLIPSGICIKLGQKVQITDKVEGWYAGVNMSTGAKGIFPASYVCFSDYTTTDPVIRELHTVLREWTLLLQSQCAVRVSSL